MGILSAGRWRVRSPYRLPGGLSAAFQVVHHHQHLVWVAKILGDVAAQVTAPN
jgi:hypothetical protein